MLTFNALNILIIGVGVGQKKRPYLSIAQQIAHLEGKGVKFIKCSREDVISYLSGHNNYFKLRAFRTGFEKYDSGPKKGKYIDLDFAQLQDLAIIDMELRYQIIQVALDVEHFAIVKLLSTVQKKGEDGYGIVRDYLDSLDDDQRKRLDGELKRHQGSTYCGGLIKKYKSQLPVWVFVEVISFGTLVYFYKFCATRFNDRSMKNDYYLLLGIRELRNAAAHNNCLINDLRPNTATYATQYAVSKALGNIGLVRDSRKKKMTNARIQQIVTLLFAHKYFVSSPGVRRYQGTALGAISLRMFRNRDYYLKNEQISTSFEFLKIVIDNWFETGDNSPT